MQRTPLLLLLRQQALDSRRMGAELPRVLGPELAAGVLPGRYAQDVWSLGASSPAVAAKLKLHIPGLLRRLQEAGWTIRGIQVRVTAPQRGQAPRPEPAQEGSAAPAAVRERLRALRERR